METDEQTITFENVSIDEFFDKDDTPQNDISTGIVVLTPKQKEMVDDLCERMVVVAPEQLNNITDRMSRLEGLAKSLALPSGTSYLHES